MNVNLIPMAGEGKRFKDEGYTISKPFIEIKGKPMIVRALECLPKAEKNILIFRKDVISQDKLWKILNPIFKKVELIGIDYLTDGQASTCLLAEDIIDDNDSITIGACDIGVSFDTKSFNKALENHQNLVWIYKGNPNARKNPQMYGWVETFKNKEIIQVHCKKPFSKNLETDPIVSGIFTFNKASNLFDGIQKMHDNNDKVNGEFYLDNVINHLKNPSIIFEVNQFYSWGTPIELKQYLGQIK